MKLLIAEDYADLSRRAARHVADLLRALDAPTAVLPTGNTPLGMYEELIAAREAGRLDLSRLRLFQLDEYAGIARDDWRSFDGWLRRAFLDRAGVAPGAVTRFDPEAPDPVAEASRMERAIAAAGGIDLLVVGLGLNGHVGFNEPGSPPDSPTRLVDLAPESLRSNAAYWGDEGLVPRRAYTLGLGTLSKARQSLLLVSGGAKAEILAATLDGPVTPEVPATFLRDRPGVTVIADRAALAVARPSP